MSLADPLAGEDRARIDHRNETRADYRYFLAIPTRWMDNDSYGHVNNVIYYSYFDTAVNEHLINAGGLDIRNGPVVGFVVETSCRFYRPLSFPDIVDVGLRITRLGTSSVSYEIGLFAGGRDEPAATGRFVHVWVDRETVRPAAIPPHIRVALEPLVVAIPAPRTA
jgi:acyl-CoA thioester hydrolase